MGKDVNFDPDKDVPDLVGKVIFITGGTAGLGKESIIVLAKHNPEHIYFSGRDSARATAVINDVKSSIPNANLTFLECDLASLSSVSSTAKQFLSTSQRLDILMCNAGIMAVPAGLTKDGYEIQFGTNHIGNALLIKLLLPALLHTASLPNTDVRIVLLASRGYSLHPSGGIIFKDLRTTQEMTAGTWIRYGQSKLANILYAKSLAKQYPQITSVAVHPGIIATGLVGNLSFWNRALVYVTNVGKVKEPKQGIVNQVWAATGDKKDIVKGGYYEPVGVPGRQDKESSSDALAEELWQWTQNELRSYEN